MTMFSAPDFTGAATMTFFTPVAKYGSSVSVVRNLPLHSSTMSTLLRSTTAPRLDSLPLKNVIDVAVDRPSDARRLDAPIPSAMDGVERQEVRGGLGTAGDLVDVDELQVLASPAGAQGEPSHPAESVDSDSRGHPAPSALQRSCASRSHSMGMRR